MRYLPTHGKCGHAARRRLELEEVTATQSKTLQELMIVDTISAAKTMHEV